MLEGISTTFDKSSFTSEPSFVFLYYGFAGDKANELDKTLTGAIA
jgi:hypothetical protein